jgi:hypothetical protein
MTPADNNRTESITGKYLERENPQPQTHPERNKNLNSRKSIDRKNESNSPRAKLSIKKPIPANNNIKMMKEGKNRNRNE